jgi:broad specificity phosphatase PhoE
VHVTCFDQLIRYLTHPQVQIDPSAPVTSWRLSPVGRSRVRALAGAGWLRGTTQVITSAEKKAMETAEPIAAALGVQLEIRDAMHENDRSATGYPPDEFENVANQFFAEPDISVRGWERARDAQMRIVREATLVLDRRQGGHVLFVGHGAVGTLLLCHYGGLAISRVHDQPPGGGHYFTVTNTNKLAHPWRRMEEAP